MSKIPKSKHEAWRKRPDDATPEKALELRRAGLTFKEIGKLWDISAAQVFEIVKRANSPNS